MHLHECEKRRLKADQFACYVRNKFSDEWREETTSEINSLDKVRHNEHERGGDVLKCDLTVQELKFIVDIAIRRRWTLVGDAKRLPADIRHMWVVVNEAGLIEKMGERAILDIDKRGQNARYPCGVVLSDEVGST